MSGGTSTLNWKGHSLMKQECQKQKEHLKTFADFPKQVSPATSVFLLGIFSPPVGPGTL